MSDCVLCVHVCLFTGCPSQIIRHCVLWLSKYSACCESFGQLWQRYLRSCVSAQLSILVSLPFFCGYRIMIPLPRILSVCLNTFPKYPLTSDPVFLSVCLDVCSRYGLVSCLSTFLDANPRYSLTSVYRPCAQCSGAVCALGGRTSPPPPR